MKNTALIKAGIVIGVVVLIIFAVVGNLMKGKGGKETASTEASTKSREEISTTVEPVSRKETKEERSTGDTESYTIQAEYPVESPEVDPDPEEYDNVQVHIYFTNTEELDSSNLLPLTAWEKLSVQAQEFLNENNITAEEIRVIDGTMKKDGNIVSFDSTFPDMPGSQFIVAYDLDLRQFSFQAKAPGIEAEPEPSSKIESLPDDETGGTE